MLALGKLLELTLAGREPAAKIQLTPEGKKVLIDPFLANNPSCPERFHELDVDAILITHGHADHARPGHGVVVATQRTLRFCSS